MKTIFKYTILSITLFFIGCKKEEVTMPKVTYDSISKGKVENQTKLATIFIADLPIEITGTSVLIHPIGEFNVSDGSKNLVNNSSYSDGENFRISNYSEFEVSGLMTNVKFQQVGQDSLTSLTDKPIAIQRITFLKSIAEKTKKQLLIYVLEDMDSNKDRKIDSNDIKNLYISDVNGKNLAKLSADLHELIDWNVIDAQNRLYFRTIEDINKNGAFDKDDKLHYHYVDLLSKEMEVKEYNPVN